MWIYIWLGVVVASLVVELSTFALVSIWFAVGGAVAAGMAAFDLPVWAQVAAFLVVSLVLFALLWKRLAGRKIVKTNSPALIGRKCVVTEEISNLAQTGRVAVDGLTWAAKNVSEDGVIPVGAVTVIREIRGVHLICEAIEPDHS